MFLLKVSAEDFTNALAAARQAEHTGNISSAMKFYSTAESLASTNAGDWELLSRHYSDLMPSTNSVEVKVLLLDRATACAQRAVQLAPNNASAHASLGVCFAKRCTLADTRGQVTYSRLFKQEAETAIALDPKQDIAYYLLGRWNYGVAHLGFFAHAYVKVVYGGLPKASNDAAIANFQRAVALAPDHILYHAGLAMAYEAAGKRELQIAELEKCVKLKPAYGDEVEAQQEARRKLAALGR